MHAAIDPCDPTLVSPFPANDFLYTRQAWTNGEECNTNGHLSKRTVTRQIQIEIAIIAFLFDIRWIISSVGSFSQDQSVTNPQPKGLSLYFYFVE